MENPGPRPDDGEPEGGEEVREPWHEGEQLGNDGWEDEDDDEDEDEKDESWSEEDEEGEYEGEEVGEPPAAGE